MWAAARAAQQFNSSTSGTVAASTTSAINVFDALMLGADDGRLAGYSGLTTARGQGLATTSDFGMAAASANLSQVGSAGREILFVELVADHLQASVVAWPFTAYGPAAEAPT
jgi:hypothetical protein